MNVTELVQQKLGQDLVCKQAIECVRINNGNKSPKLAAVVEKNDEYGVFIFKSKQVPCLQANDLVLESVTAVDIGLRCQAQIPPRQDKQPGDVHVHLKSGESHILLEMPHIETTTELLMEIIKQSKVKQTLSILFNEKSASQWLSKYGSLADQTRSKDGTGGADELDLFDPLRHMNIQQADTLVYITDAEKTQKSIPVGDHQPSTHTEPSFPHNSTTLQPAQRSGSRESLDEIDSFKDGSTDSMDAMQMQLGISSGAELPVGAKPVSSREKFVRQFLTEREKEFTNLKDFKVFCGSWNVNGQSPAETLQSWLLVDEEPPDIYAIGFQELDLSKEAFIFTDSPKEAEWQAAVKACINAKVPFKKVKSIRLVGVLLLVFIQEKHSKLVNYIDWDSVPTGIMGIMGNKGGVSVRFSLHSTSLCFVNSHLAAHQEEFERRNSDYRDIMNKTRFKQFEPPLVVQEHDIVFWVGDLNYRIDMPMDEVRAYIRKSMYTKLLEGDQLNRQMKTNSDVFKKFQEGFPNFDPTYKFDPGTDNYDSSEKNRIPAWCDRILWRGEGVQQMRYSSHPELKISDHKPVSSVFTIGVKVIDQKRYKRVYEDIMKKLDRLENDYLPQIKLDTTECVFKDVKFIEVQSQIVTIANIGQVPLEFEFVNKPNDTSYCKPWLKVTPNKSIIQAGHCCEVTIEVYVDKSTAAKFNSADEKIEDILVLHLTNGKDSFITVNGNYIVSSFGSSIEALIQMHRPIREVPAADLFQIEKPGSLSRVDIAQDGGRLYMVPKEIWKLTDFIHKHGLDKEDLFQQPGRNSEIQLIRDCLDTGKPSLIPDSVSVHSVAESLLLFLECLSQPVIPYEFYTQCLASSNNLLLSKQLLSHLPDCHKNTFSYMCAFLRELLKHSAKNGLDNKFLSTMFGEVILRPPPSAQVLSKSRAAPSARDRKTRMREEEAKKAAFMYHFVSHDVDL